MTVPFENWLTSKGHLVDLRAKALSWPNEWGLNLTDIHVEITLHGKKFFGRGSAFNRNQALVKAAAEAFERSVIPGGENSSGFAAHVIKETACKNAVNEMAERDLFLCHFHSKTPFLKLGISLQDLILIDHDLLKKYSIVTRFFNLGSVDGRTCVMCMSSVKEGFFLGFGTSSKIETGALKAFIESFRHVIFSIKSSVGNSCTDKILSLEQPTFADHGGLSHNSNYRKQVSFLFSSTCQRSKVNSLLTGDLFTLTNMSAIPELSDLPLHFVRAKSERVQKIYLGKPEINYDRLSHFGMRVYRKNNVLNLPHPIN